MLLVSHNVQRISGALLFANVGGEWILFRFLSQLTVGATLENWLPLGNLSVSPLAVYWGAINVVFPLPPPNSISPIFSNRPFAASLHLLDV